MEVSVGEDGGTPLQYSCLENPVDAGAWWAAVRGVAGSWTWGYKGSSRHSKLAGEQWGLWFCLLTQR